MDEWIIGGEIYVVWCEDDKFGEEIYTRESPYEDLGAHI